MNTTAPSKSPLVWIVTTPSAYRAGHQCLIGSGSSKNDALEQAYGPREDWGKSTKASIRRATIEQVSEDTLHEMEERQ